MVSGGSASVCLWAATKLTWELRRAHPSLHPSALFSVVHLGAHASRRMWPCFQVPCPAAQLFPPRGSTWRNTSPRGDLIGPSAPCRRRRKSIVLGSWGAGDWLLTGTRSRSGIDERRATTQRYGYWKNCHLIATPDLQVPAPGPDQTARLLCEKRLGETFVSAKSNLAPFSLFRNLELLLKDRKRALACGAQDPGSSTG